MSQLDYSIQPVQLNSDALSAYRRMRCELFEMDAIECERETAEILANSRWAVFVAVLSTGDVAGCLEVFLREYAEGADSSPVGYLEGLYVAAEYRRHGIGAALVRAGEEWAASQGCTEIASDARIENAISIELHKRMGYQEVERQVCFLKRLL